MSQENKAIVVVGAGLSGCCIALLFTKLFKNQRIILIESRDDYRFELERINEATASSVHGQFTDAATRSINLALSYRGICALEECGLYSEIMAKKLLILMKGRYVHLDGNKISKQLYGQENEGIHSISRLTLNCLFLDKLSICDNIEIKFKCQVTKVLENGTVLLKNGKGIESLFVIGADGAYSCVRSSIQRLGRYDFNITYVKHGYKELTVFPKQKSEEKDGNAFEFKMPENYLHIWPKHEFMLIGLPNPDKTFTMTLFAPWEVLKTLENDEKNIEQFFKKHFPDFPALCPNYISQCVKNPASSLAYINLNKWNYKNKVLLIGDAAHAIVPFFGQGMNAGFEDCLILYNMFKDNLQSTGGNVNDLNVEEVFNKFSVDRQPSTKALSQLSLQNYIEMRSLTAKRWFIYKKKLEKVLNYFVPSVWKPIYSMVAFTTIPYDDALERAKKQDKYLSVGLSSSAMFCVLGMAAIAYKQWRKSR